MAGAVLPLLYSTLKDIGELTLCDSSAICRSKLACFFYANAWRVEFFALFEKNTYRQEGVNQVGFDAGQRLPFHQNRKRFVLLRGHQTTEPRFLRKLRGGIRREMYLRVKPRVKLVRLTFNFCLSDLVL